MLVVSLSIAAGDVPVQGRDRDDGRLFTEMLAASGIDYRNVSGSPSKRYILSSLGSGACLLDLDLDGLLDLHMVNGARLEGTTITRQEPDRLYRNHGGWRFQEVTRGAATGVRGWGTGCAVGDVDNDGYDDLFVTGIGTNALLRNNGDGTFADITARAGLEDRRSSASAAFFDAEQDGDLDLYVTNYVSGSPATLPVDCDWYGLEVFCGPIGLTAAADVYYENEGNATFREATQGAGLGEVEAAFGLGVVSGDYDDDGDTDLYVANDSTPNFLFENDGTGRFSDVALFLGVAYSGDGMPQAGMGVDMGDLNGDGRFDLFVTNFSHDTNTVYTNTGSGVFVDDTAHAGLSRATWPYLGWGTGMVDLDHDGDLDLFVANGHIYPQVDGEALDTSYRQLNQVFWNEGGSFIEAAVAPADGLAALHSSRGAALGDLDNDGDPDVVVINIDEAPSLLRNDRAQGDWVQFRLVGRRANRNAIGARVTVTVGGRRQVEQVSPSGSYLSSGDPRVHFGLGAASRIERVSIRWPGGQTQVLTDLESGMLHRVVEPRRQ